MKGRADLTELVTEFQRICSIVSLQESLHGFEVNTQQHTDPPLCVLLLIFLHVQGGLSPATSEMNLYTFNSRSTSPVGTPTLASPRPRFSAYDALIRKRNEINNPVCLLIHTQITHSCQIHVI